ncbi:MAG: zinc transporter ZupT [Candidatus Eisenbacteria bacterium]|uniref:Zinc transporter ZupT n=1 Tax=Eiseniibacteriota bacterium TaxID=2212470 RepID=A0A937X9C4_UNCEI|nr:zinc transporter ZupT [Candidatus Eisenbacteria bacterium]
MNGVWVALGLTLFAGMATAIGSVIAFTAKRTNYRFLSVATGFSAGVMLYVSFVEILFKGAESLLERFGEPGAHWVNAGSFFGGMLLIGLIDHLIPAAENPHEVHSEAETLPLRGSSAPALDFGAVSQSEAGSAHLHDQRAHRRLLRLGLFTALAIGIHNFPEGLATFLAALQDPSLGVAIAIAIALHNIPEGISVSVPIFYATGSRKKAFLYSALSGLAEPVGAIIGYAAIRFFVGGQTGVVPPEVMGVLFGGVAGIMVYISLDELLPTSRAYGKGHDSLLGLVAGMLVMAISLLLMK